MTGLSCARQLISQGYSVHVFEQHETVAGRMATTVISSASTQSLRFDHGTQYFTVRSPEFSQQVDLWNNQKVVQQWFGPFVSLDGGACGSAIGDDARYVGCPGMDALCVDLARQCFESKNGCSKLTLQATVLPLHREAEGWRVQYQNSATRLVIQEQSLFDAVVLTVPSSKVKSILPSDSPLLTEAAPIQMAPCLAVLLAFEESLSLPYGGVFVQESLLRWISNNSSMPGRNRLPEQWTLHPSSQWSAEHMGDTDAEILTQVCAAFEAATAIRIPSPLLQSVYRWEDAIPVNPTSQGYFSDPAQRLILAGDWCNDARVEGAYASGLKAAKHLVEQIMTTM